MSSPLAGLRGVEMAGFGPGPFGAMPMPMPMPRPRPDLGASVLRTAGPGAPLEPPDLATRSRRQRALDLREPAGARDALALVARTPDRPCT